MPVPTDTLWNMKKLNRWFAVSAVLLVLTFVWAIIQDYDKGWRRIQINAKGWDAAIVRAKMEQKDEETNQKRLEYVTRRVADLEKQYGRAATPGEPEVPGTNKQHE